MNVEFVGEPKRPTNGAAVFRVDGRADGHSFVCTVTEETIRTAAGAAAPQTPAEMVATFRRHEGRFRDVAAALLTGRDPLPDAFKIRDADLRRDAPAP